MSWWNRHHLKRWCTGIWEWCPQRAKLKSNEEESDNGELLFLNSAILDSMFCFVLDSSISAFVTIFDHIGSKNQPAKQGYGNETLPKPLSVDEKNNPIAPSQDTTIARMLLLLVVVDSSDRDITSDPVALRNAHVINTPDIPPTNQINFYLYYCYYWLNHCHENFGIHCYYYYYASNYYQFEYYCLEMMMPVQEASLFAD